MWTKQHSQFLISAEKGKRSSRFLKNNITYGVCTMMCNMLLNSTQLFPLTVTSHLIVPGKMGRSCCAVRRQGNMHKHYWHDLQLSLCITDSWKRKWRCWIPFKISEIQIALNPGMQRRSLPQQPKQTTSSETWQAFEAGMNSLYICWCVLNADSRRHSQLLFGVRMKDE